MFEPDWRNVTNGVVPKPNSFGNPDRLNQTLKVFERKQTLFEPRSASNITLVLDVHYPYRETGLSYSWSGAGLSYSCSGAVVFSVVLVCTTSVLYLDRSGEAVDSRRDPGLSSEQREGRPVL